MYIMVSNNNNNNYEEWSKLANNAAETMCTSLTGYSCAIGGIILLLTIKLL